MEPVHESPQRKAQKAGKSGENPETKGSLGKLTPPEPISSDHDVSAFCSGEPSLDDWLVRRAASNHQRDFSRVFVVCNEQAQVVGYYALSSYSVDRKDIPNIKQAPNPIPAVLIGRIAVDQSWQGRGLGQSLMRDALQRIISAKEDIGIKVIVVHALNDNVAQYYKRMDFEELGKSNLELFIKVDDLETTFGNL